MTSRRTTLAASAVCGVLALVAAGCGAQEPSTSSGSAAPRDGGSPGGSPSGSPSGSASSGSSSDRAADATWLLRFDAYGGEDGEQVSTRYVRVVPRSGEAEVATMPQVDAPEARSPALLVDAGHRYAVPDTRPAAADRTAGRVVVRDLADGGAARTIDVRRAAGDAGLEADWVSFDPTEPGLLRVVSGRDVWAVQVASGTAERDGTVPRRKDWIYSGGFDIRTGAPFIESLSTFDTLPAGNGDDVEHPIRRSGGTVIDPNAEEPYGDRPAPGCETSAGFAAADGTDWAFCQVGTRIQVKRLAKGSRAWTTLGTTKAVLSADASPVLALPPATG